MGTRADRVPVGADDLVISGWNDGLGNTVDFTGLLSGESGDAGSTTGRTSAPPELRLTLSTGSTPEYRRAFLETVLKHATELCAGVPLTPLIRSRYDG